MNAVARECVEEHRQCRNEGLTLTCCHFGYLSLMQHAATKQLYVVVYHFPLQVVASGRPVVVVDGLVAVDGDEVVGGISREVTVKLVGCYHSFLVLGKASRRFLDDGKHLWHGLVEFFFVDVENFLFELVNLLEQFGTLVNRRVLDSFLY